MLQFRSFAVSQFRSFAVLQFINSFKDLLRPPKITRGFKVHHNGKSRAPCQYRLILNVRRVETKGMASTPFFLFMMLCSLMNCINFIYSTPSMEYEFLAMLRTHRLLLAPTFCCIIPHQPTNNSK